MARPKVTQSHDSPSQHFLSGPGPGVRQTPPSTTHSSVVLMVGSGVVGGSTFLQNPKMPSMISHESPSQHFLSLYLHNLPSGTHFSVVVMVGSGVGVVGGSTFLHLPQVQKGHDPSHDSPLQHVMSPWGVKGHIS